jgi:hypothetical protein
MLGNFTSNGGGCESESDRECDRQWSYHLLFGKQCDTDRIA